MKKLITKTFIVAILALGPQAASYAQCSFTGLAPAYCRGDAAVSLTASSGGGYFTGPGMIGSVFSPTLAGGGTHTITYGICTNSYNVSSGTFSMLPAAGTPVSLTDDQVGAACPIGFDFRFFCSNTYTAFYVSSNGFVTFDVSNYTNNTSGCCTGQVLPSATTPNNLIALAWQDFNPGSGGTITYTTLGTAPNRIAVLTYSNVPHFSGGGPLTAQLQLYEGTNEIQIHTASMQSNGSGHTMGIEDPSGSTAFVVSGRNSSSSWSASNEMYKFTPIFNCVSSQTTNVDANNLVVSGQPTVCLHSAVTLTASGTNTYTWNTTETTAMITVTPNATTVYTVTGVAPGSAACVYNTSYTVTVYSTPLAATSMPALLCVGSTATLTGTGASTYTWSTSDQTNTTEVAPNVTTTYTLWGTSNLGCEEEITFTQNVNANVLSISNSTSVCLGSAANLTVSGGNTYTWSTTPPSPFSMITVTPNTMTQYSVGATDANNCYLDASVTVSVNPIPNITLTTPKQTVCKGEAVVFTAGGGNTYQWSQGSSTGNTIVVIPTVDLPLTVTVTGSNQFGCTNKNSVTINVSKCTGIDEISSDATLLGIYPNPSSGIFNLKKTTASVSKAEVYNSVGALITTLDLNDEITVLNLTGYANGVYFVKVSDKSGAKQVTRIVNQ